MSRTGRALRTLALRLRLARSPDTYAQVTRQSVDDTRDRIGIVEQKVNGLIVGLLLLLVIEAALRWL